jgi:effector-binding domain-containing protein
VSYEVEVREEVPRDVLCIAARTTLMDIGGTLGECFGEIGAYAAERGYQFVGPPFVAYPDRLDQGIEGTVEVCFPVAPGAEPRGRVELRRVSGGPVAWTMHRGPYDQVGAAYAALQAWVAQNGRQMAGPPRETYLNDPGETPPDELLTEVAFPLA